MRPSDQRDAANRCQSRIHHPLNAVRRKFSQPLGIRHDCSPSFYSLARRSFIDAGRGAFLNARIPLEYERVDAQLVRARDAQRKARVFVRNRTPETSRDRWKKVVDVQL